MSCNAWNHPPNCNCGWGGIFHGLGLTSGSHYWQKSESYTNPNASCPRCRAKVFYYESPYGGKVYFDQMGPPWAKHPCMDTYAYGASHTKVTGRKVGVSFISQPKPQQIQIEDGWMPVYCFEIQVSDRLPDYLDFALFDVKNRKHLYAKFSRQLVDSRSPILIRRIKDQLNYEISTLNVREAKPAEIRLFAFTTIEEAEVHEKRLKEQELSQQSEPKPLARRVENPLPIKPTLRTVLNLKSHSKKTSKKSQIAALKRDERAAKRETREFELKQKPRVKTALEIAFDEARGKT